MDFKDCIDFANENPIAWLATSEGNQPHVRALGMWFADERGFYFQIGGTKDVYKQLLKNPHVEVGFYKSGEMSGTMMRVTGEVEFVEDLEMKKKVLEDRPFLKEFGLTPDNPSLVIFKIPKGKAHFWNMTTNLEPKMFINFGD
jgi:pyridoxamine 5'-phosphate oxidase